MTQHIDPCATARNNVLAAVLALQQCTKTAANLIPIPGTAGVIAIGTRAWITKNVADSAQVDEEYDPIDDLVDVIDIGAQPERHDVADSEGGHHD